MTKINYAALEAIPWWSRTLLRTSGNWRRHFGIKFLYFLWAVLCLAVTLYIETYISVIIYAKNPDADFPVFLSFALFIAIFFVLTLTPYRHAKRVAVRQFKQFAADNGIGPYPYEDRFQIRGMHGAYNFKQTSVYIPFTQHDGFNMDISQLSVNIGREVPQIIFDSVSNDSFLSSQAEQYDQRQRLVLEGDFNDYYRVYAPEKFRIDALSIVTPDVMAALIDSGAQLDVEINHQGIYVKAPEHVAYDATMLKAMMKTMDTILAEVMHRMRSWQDLEPSGDLLLARAKHQYALSVGKHRLPVYTRWIGYALETAPYILVFGLINVTSVTVAIALFRERAFTMSLFALAGGIVVGAVVCSVIRDLDTTQARKRR